MPGMDGFINFNGTLEGSIAGGDSGAVKDVKTNASGSYQSVVDEAGNAMIDLSIYAKETDVSEDIQSLSDQLDNKQDIINYSMNEQVIGTYLGKPLYGKLVKLQNCSFTTQYSIFNRYVYNIANDFPTVRNIWVDLDASYISEMYQGIEYQRSMVFYEVETDSTQTYAGISLYHRGEYSGVDIILALRYTKTTD
jgi:hypothetical protein